MKFAPATMLLVSLSLVFACVETDGVKTQDTDPLPEDPGSGPFDCAVSDQYVFDAIDDFEFGASTGTWFANNDICEDCQGYVSERDELLELADTDTNASNPELEQVIQQLARCRQECDDSQSPNIFDKPLPAELISADGRCSSQYALHLTTKALLGWGANIGNVFPVPMDASSFDGISFWARRAPHSRGTVRIEIADKHTDGEYDGEDGPYCSLEYTDDTLSEGCDRFGSYALVGTDWQLFTIPFNDMRQAGWGRQAPFFDTSGLRSLTFLFPTGQWDIWIDDVAYYTRRFK